MSASLIIPVQARAYTQTHTFTFCGCKNISAVETPENKAAVNALKHEFAGLLIRCGFEVTGEDGEHEYEYDVICRGFGKGCGVTMVAILSGSDATIHAYIEEAFGMTVEFELNLCYLPNRIDHSHAVRRSKHVVQDWLKAQCVIESHSKRRYLHPLSELPSISKHRKR